MPSVIKGENGPAVVPGNPPVEPNEPNEVDVASLIDEAAITLFGVKRGLEAERIIAASETDGQLMFLVKWVGDTRTNIIPAKMANLMCPQVVIKFYEDRLLWNENERKIRKKSRNSGENKENTFEGCEGLPDTE